MTQKEKEKARLVELLIFADGDVFDTADYLLDNGVIVMSCEEYSGAKFLGYDLEALACVAYSLEHNGITAEQLDQYKLDFEFALRACWNTRCEYIKKSENEIIARFTPDFGFWLDDWENKQKFKSFNVPNFQKSREAEQALKGREST